MSLSDVRRRLPVVASLPAPDNRWMTNPARREAKAPRWAVWELTLACDQHCAHCGPRAGQRRPNELTTEECLQVVRELKELGCGEVVLIGGEAYLRNDFILIIRAIREAGMACTMTTGGLNLNEERAAAMIEAGIGSVTFSVDGLQATHDRLRGVPGSWERAFAAMRRIRDAGGRIASNTQINALTRTELLPLFELLADEGIHSWQLQITVPHGNAADHPEILLQPHMFLDIFKTLEQVLDRCEARGVRLWPGNNLGYFGPLERRMRNSQRKHWRGCTAGVSVMGIESDGSIKNCPSLGGGNNIGGNWRVHGVKKVWEESYQLGYIRARTVDDLWGYCRECYYAETCMAGCTAAAEPLLGRPGNNPFCHHRALMMDRAGLRERIEQIRGAGGQPFDNGLFRVIREHADPALRELHGPVAVEEPRVSRAEEPFGAGRTLVL
ncbi:radical SAM protein [Nannocystis sp. SCPEA4]|uniref:radical SAM/SPASM domain-containing protein n=1 Tax=Nannocystis sp. SCPEA4 TaxID=2996787 RepID=UPI00226D5CEA|nr:radical SAM protein [Nannocystis sp. SCPEA4]MCY1062598.1 radical SAM protein [Nannocystis sp. SCPEA4]